MIYLSSQNRAQVENCLVKELVLCLADATEKRKTMKKRLREKKPT